VKYQAIYILAQFLLKLSLFAFTKPRRARIDDAGALHHIICRRIDGCRIYRDDSDRQDFLSRLVQRVSKEQNERPE